MTDRYEDCVSCAFQGEDHPICDSCEDADQWEPADEDMLDSGEDISAKPIYFYPLKKAA
jgi:hypothetical protein